MTWDKIEKSLNTMCALGGISEAAADELVKNIVDWGAEQEAAGYDTGYDDGFESGNPHSHC